MNGLVLIGGRSTRMGTDKSLLTYHQQPQWLYLQQLLQPFCQNVFLCGRPEQYQAAFGAYWLADHFQQGPMGGILTAFEHDNSTAWLVVACDMPFVTAACLDFLTAHRNETAEATAFLNPDRQTPEPLLTIWEPTAMAVLKEAWVQQKYALMPLLDKTSTQLLPCPNPQWLRNFNNPEDLTLISSQN